MRPSTMNFGGVSFVWGLVTVLAFLPVGWAGSMSAKCNSGWEWAENSLGQNPCQVAGDLQASCLGYSDYVLSPLEPASYYIPPGENDTDAQNCGCNTVIYSLYSACEACQTRTVIQWGQWEAYCKVVYVSEYPFNIRGDTAVPRWAFINVTEQGIFNVTSAENVGRDPEATGTTPATLSLISTSSTKKVPFLASSYSSSPSTSGNDINGATSTQKNVAAIIGGVVGGVAGLVIIALLLFWRFSYRNSRGAPPNDATRPLSARSLSFSARSRGSYYPPSVPAYAHEPETVERDWSVPEVYSRAAVPSREPVYDNHDAQSTMSSIDFDVQTTYNSPHYIAQHGGNPAY